MADKLCSQGMSHTQGRLNDKNRKSAMKENKRPDRFLYKPNLVNILKVDMSHKQKNLSK
jgi:hypothetical protein